MSTFISLHPDCRVKGPVTSLPLHLDGLYPASVSQNKCFFLQVDFCHVCGHKQWQTSLFGDGKYKDGFCPARCTRSYSVTPLGFCTMDQRLPLTCRPRQSTTANQDSLYFPGVISASSWFVLFLLSFLDSSYRMREDRVRNEEFVCS